MNNIKERIRHILGSNLDGTENEFDVCADQILLLILFLQKIKNGSPFYIDLWHTLFDDVPSGKRYNMCEDQPSQIDCRQTNCIHNNGGGECKNVSPAITLNENGQFVCWSKFLPDNDIHP